MTKNVVKFIVRKEKDGQYRITTQTSEGLKMTTGDSEKILDKIQMEILELNHD